MRLHLAKLTLKCFYLFIDPVLYHQITKMKQDSTFGHFLCRGESPTFFSPSAQGFPWEPGQSRCWDWHHPDLSPLGQSLLTVSQTGRSQQQPVCPLADLTPSCPHTAPHWERKAELCGYPFRTLFTFYIPAWSSSQHHKAWLCLTCLSQHDITVLTSQWLVASWLIWSCVFRPAAGCCVEERMRRKEWRWGK